MYKISYALQTWLEFAINFWHIHKTSYAFQTLWILCEAYTNHGICITNMMWEYNKSDMHYKHASKLEFRYKCNILAQYALKTCMLHEHMTYCIWYLHVCNALGLISQFRKKYSGGIVTDCHKSVWNTCWISRISCCDVWCWGSL